MWIIIGIAVYIILLIFALLLNYTAHKYDKEDEEKVNDFIREKNNEK